MPHPPLSVSVFVPITPSTAPAALAQTLDALQAQLQPNWEALVADAGAPDETSATAATYSQQDDRIRYSGKLAPQQEPEAIYAACIQEAQHQHALWLAAGTYIHPRHLQQLQDIYPLAYFQLLYHTQPDEQALLQAIRSEAERDLLPRQARLLLARTFLQRTAITAPVTVGPLQAQVLEVSGPLPDVIAAGSAERLFAVVQLEGTTLGTFELPICDRTVPEWLLRDAIAAKFSWEILGKFFAHTRYPAILADAPPPTDPSASLAQLHHDIGWQEFLRQLWGKPNMAEDQFYDAASQGEESNLERTASNITYIEVSEEIPAIVAGTPEVYIAFTVAGTAAGLVSVPVTKGRVSAQAIRAGITTAGNFELCRVCVREALIGQPLHTNATLRERLAPQNTGNTVDAPEATLVLGQRFGKIGTSASRHALLPVAALPEIQQMAQATQEPTDPALPLPAAVEHILYRPEVLRHPPVAAAPQQQSRQQAAAAESSRHYFETLFVQQPDPWKYTHPYEETKYAQTLSLLPQVPLRNAIEIACAEGHFTRQLAPRVQHLVAADISAVALSRAAARCSDFSNITYRQLDLQQEEIPGIYDLMVCSEMLYYLGSVSALQAVAKKMARALSPGGYLLMAHAHQLIDDPKAPGYDWGFPFGAKRISEVFSAIPALALRSEIRTPLYRIQLFQHAPASLLSRFTRPKPQLTTLPQPTPVPPRVADTVRWEGGKPAAGADFLAPVTTKALPILMYHRIAATGLPHTQRYRVSPAALEEQLRFLRDSGYHSVTLSDWVNACIDKKPLPGQAVLLTFDDGYADFYDEAWPILKRYGFSATVFLVAGLVGQTNAWDRQFGEETALMNWEQVKELHSEGVEFGAHSMTHPPLTALPPADIVREMAGARALIQEKGSIIAKAFAYPYGAADEAVAHLAGACGYTTGLSCLPGRSTFQSNLLLLPRIEVSGTERLEQFITKLEA